MTAAAASSDKQRLQFGRYTVEARLGEGGMAYTWLCRLYGAKGISRPYVLKTLKPNCRTPQFVTMFVDEARIGARFEHPNLARIVELGDMNGVPFLVQEFVDGPTLYQVMGRQSAQRAVDVPFGVRVVADVAGALHWVYNLEDEQGARLNVVHRDVSLSNIVVSRQGVPKLIDFGVARFDGRETETEVGLLKGRLRYMAPEVIQRNLVTHRSDIYSLGICLYSVATGIALPGDDRFVRLADPHQTDLDRDLAAIVLRCVAPNPADRWASGLDLKHALERWLEARGFRVGPEEVADRIAYLFPAGPAEWRSDELTSALQSELTSNFGTLPSAPTRTTSLLPWIAAAFGAGSLVLGAVALVLILLLLRPAPTSADPQVALLDRAESALALGRVDEAAAAVTTLSGAELAPDVRQRLQQLDERVTAARIVRLRELGATDPAAALVSARALAVERPDNTDVSALVDSLAAAAAPAPTPAAPTPTPSPAPARPRPATPAPSGDDALFGERIGRPPSP